jgi:hypothetical protein
LLFAAGAAGSMLVTDIARGVSLVGASITEGTGCFSSAPEPPGFCAPEDAEGGLVSSWLTELPPIFSSVSTASAWSTSASAGMTSIHSSARRSAHCFAGVLRGNCGGVGETSSDRRNAQAMVPERPLPAVARLSLGSVGHVRLIYGPLQWSTATRSGEPSSQVRISRATRGRIARGGELALASFQLTHGARMIVRTDW